MPPERFWSHPWCSHAPASPLIATGTPPAHPAPTAVYFRVKFSKKNARNLTVNFDQAERPGRDHCGMGRGGGGNAGNAGKGQSLAESHNQLIELLQENVNEEITVWNLPLGDKLWLPAAEALKTNTACKRLTIYGCDIGLEGAAALANALMVNTGLESIDYNDNKMSWAGLRKIAAAWSKTRTEAARNTIATGGKWSASEVYKRPEAASTKAAEVRAQHVYAVYADAVLFRGQYCTQGLRGSRYTPNPRCLRAAVILLTCSLPAFVQVAVDPMAGKSQYQWAQDELADERRRKREQKEFR